MYVGREYVVTFCADCARTDNTILYKT